MRRFMPMLAAIALLSAAAHGDSVTVVGEGFIPETGQEITIAIVTSTPLMLLEVTMSVTGDATISGMMTEEDSTDYGWDPFWTGNGYVDGNNATFNCVSWSGDANDVVGYFKFIYHGGEVRINVTGDASGPDGVVIFESRQLRFGYPVSSISVPDEPDGRPFAGAYDIDGGWGPATPGDPPLNEPLVYDANTILTVNTVWQGRVHLNASVTVDGCILAIMPGTTIYNATDSGGIIVRNDGILIADGTNMKRISFLPVKSDPAHDEYPFAVRIESTASTASVIAYAYIAGAQQGIWIENRRLQRPVEQVTINWCVTGIYQSGPELTDIINNEMINCWDSGIKIHTPHHADPNNIYSDNSHIAIRHNSIIGWFMEGRGQWFGMTIQGATDPDKATIVQMSDNLIAGSFLAMNVGDGWLIDGQRYNHGYYNNDFIDLYQYQGYDPQDEVDMKITDVYPFWSEAWPFLLRPNSVFVDGGSMRIEDAPYLVGHSTFFGVPDTGMVDIGFHYNREGYVNAGESELVADLNGDFKVDAYDLAIFASYWLLDPNDPGYDPLVNLDASSSTIDFRDFAVLASEWGMDANSVPYDIVPQFDQDSNSLSGKVTVVVDLPLLAVQSYLFIGGKISGEFQVTSLDSNSLTIDTTLYPNGLHQFKLGFLMEDGKLYQTSPVNANFNNLMYVVERADFFHPSEQDNRLMRGFYCGDKTLVAEVRDDLSETLLWSDSYGQSVDIIIPGSVFAQSYLCGLRIYEDDPNVMFLPLSEDLSDSQSIQVIKDFRMEDYNDISIGMAVILSDKDMFAGRKSAVVACFRACIERNVNWATLYDKQVTPENLEFLLSPQGRNVPYVYWMGHGASHIGRSERTNNAGVQRTNMNTWEKVLRRIFWDGWCCRKAVSYTKNSRPDAPTLPSGADDKSHDLTSLGMRQSRAKKIVFVDACESAIYSDMAETFGTISLAGYGYQDQIFIGWRRDTWYVDNGCRARFRPGTTDAVAYFWQKMGEGKTVMQAFEAVLTNGPGDSPAAFWGGNLQINIGNPSGDDNIGVWGLSDSLNNKLN